MNILNSKVGNGKAVTEKTETHFHQQIIGAPSPLNPREMVVHTIPGTGIPIRDYFAATALASSYGANAFDSSRELAEWCYRVADAMIEARKAKPEVKGFPYDETKH
jgi:hypothetical protein